MPAHRAVEEGNKDPVSLEDRWHIANFVYSARNAAVPPGDGVVTAMKLEGGLPGSPEDERWEQASATTLNLVPNIVKEERLFLTLNDSVTVRVLYNDQDIAFLLELDDRTESRPGIEYFTDLMDENLEMYPDAFAVQLPRQDAFRVFPSVEKPLYRHGDAARKTTIWYWNAGSVDPAKEPGAMLFDGSGPNKPLAPRVEDTGLQATGSWKDGKWRVVMTRPRFGGAGGDILFEDGQFIPISFANWDGSNGEAGSRHTLTTWYWLVIPPEMDLARVYGMPLGIGLLVFLGGLGLVKVQRRKAV